MPVWYIEAWSALTSFIVARANLVHSEAIRKYRQVRAPHLVFLRSLRCSDQLPLSRCCTLILSAHPRVKDLVVAADAVTGLIATKAVSPCRVWMREVSIGLILGHEQGRVCHRVMPDRSRERPALCPSGATRSMHAARAAIHHYGRWRRGSAG